MEFRANLSGADLDRLTAEAAKGFRRVQRSVGLEIAKAGRRAVLADVKQSRGSLRFGRGRLGVRTTVEPAGDRVLVTLSGRPAGPWSIVEYGSMPHVIEARRGVLAFNADWFAFSVKHPGTTGRPFWTGAEDALVAAVTPVVEAAYDDVMGV